MADLVLKVRRLHPGAVLPTKANPTDAGWDLYAPMDVSAEPGAVVRVPLGFIWPPPAGWCAVIRGRSSLALRGIAVLGGLIDPLYSREWSAVLANVGEFGLEIRYGERLAQFTLHRIPDAELIEVDKVEGWRDGFGSSGA